MKNLEFTALDIYAEKNLYNLICIQPRYHETSKHEDRYKPEQLLGEKVHWQQISERISSKVKTGSRILKGIIG